MKTYDVEVGNKTMKAVLVKDLVKRLNSLKANPQEIPAWDYYRGFHDGFEAFKVALAEELKLR